MLRNCRVLLRPIVFVISLLLIDCTALQQTFTEECTAYSIKKGDTLKLKLPEKPSMKKIELEEKATIVRNAEGKFGLRWGKEGEEACFDDNCVKKFVDNAAAKIVAAFPAKYEYPNEKEGKKHYTYVNYNGVTLRTYIDNFLKARGDGAAPAAAPAGA
jgi:hypothetical protein